MPNLRQLWNFTSPLLVVILSVLICSCNGGAGGFGGNKKKTEEKKDARSFTEDSQQVDAENEQASAPGEVAGAFLVKQNFDATRSTHETIFVNVFVSKIEDPRILSSDEIDVDASLTDQGEEESVLIKGNSDLALGTYTYVVKPHNVPDGVIKLTLNKGSSGEIIKALKDIAPGVHDELALGLIGSREMGIELETPFFAETARTTLATNIENGDFQPTMFCERGKIFKDPNSKLREQQGLNGFIKDIIANQGGFGAKKSSNFIWYPSKRWWATQESKDTCFYSGKTPTGENFSGYTKANGCFIFLVRPSGIKSKSKIYVTREALINKQAEAEIKEIVGAAPCR